MRYGAGDVVIVTVLILVLCLSGCSSPRQALIPYFENESASFEVRDSSIGVYLESASSFVSFTSSDKFDESLLHFNVYYRGDDPVLVQDGPQNGWPIVDISLIDTSKGDELYHLPVLTTNPRLGLSGRDPYPREYVVLNGPAVLGYSHPVGLTGLGNDLGDLTLRVSIELWVIDDDRPRLLSYEWIGPAAEWVK